MYAEMTIITDICNLVSQPGCDTSATSASSSSSAAAGTAHHLNLFVEILAPVAGSGGSAGTGSGAGRTATDGKAAAGRSRFHNPLPRRTVRHPNANAAAAPSSDRSPSPMSPASAATSTEYCVRADLDSPPDIAARLRPDPAGIGADTMPAQPELPLRYHRRPHFTPKVRAIWANAPRPDDIFTDIDRHNISEHLKRTAVRVAA